MENFLEIAKDVYLLKVPFGPVWTGVVLVRGEKNILVDSGATAGDVDQYIIPALKKLGMDIKDIHYLANTHAHGDHIGGHGRLRQLGNMQVVSFAGSKPKVEDPAPYGAATRTRFPEHSPEPRSTLQGVKVDMALDDIQILAGRLRLIHTPGHDNDCVCWLDIPTGTLITGDSLQGNGTICQGIGFYKSLPDYLYTLDRLGRLGVENILCGHDYDGIGYWIPGKQQVAKALAYCKECVCRYDGFVRSQINENAPVIATRLIQQHGCGMPEHLFMALYTVTEHQNRNEDLL